VETRARSLLHAVGWRLVSFVGVGVIAWAVTGDFSSAGRISLSWAFVAVVLNFFYNRLWARVLWGAQ
jgi:uncharacterized membrane protein